MADWQGRKEEALLHLTEGLGILRGHDQPRALASVLTMLADLLITTGRTGLRIQASEAAFRIGLRLGDPQMKRCLAHNLAVALSNAKDLPTTRTLHQQLQPLMRAVADDMICWRHEWLGARLASRMAAERRACLDLEDLCERYGGAGLPHD